MYISHRGYTIDKSDLTDAQQKKIREDLTIQPVTIGNYGGAADVKEYPAFRESPKRFFVPHYYGVRQFGPPTRSDLSPGTVLEGGPLLFNGQLRDYQVPVVERMVGHFVQESDAGRLAVSGLAELPCAWGKTSTALYIWLQVYVRITAGQRSKPLLVILHKDFLMNQWIERIQQFIPGAQIGRIQGPTIDVEGKDIVLCMLQSLVQKEYSSSLFSHFGFTIIDEVHHISSQTFSQALFKIKTPFMFGISATMDRKDGTTGVIKMFLGDIIQKVERKVEQPVCVRTVTYKSSDTEFNEVITNWRGEVQNSSMISKICDCTARTEFILWNHLVPHIAAREGAKAVTQSNKGCCSKCTNDAYLVRNTCCGSVAYCLPCIEAIMGGHTNAGKVKTKCPLCKKVLKYEQNFIDMGRNKPLRECHVIVMAHNLNILHYLYRRIVCANLASVGYYIGGMKEAELKQSETKQIILATYSMCSEGLDIPSLTTEFLLSPKTDVIQIVGRILRATNPYATPTIYDIVDSHAPFQRQWYRRRAYYKKQGFIIQTQAMGQTDWTVVFNAANGTRCGGSAIADASAADAEEESDEETAYEKRVGGGDVCLINH